MADKSAAISDLDFSIFSVVCQGGEIYNRNSPREKVVGCSRICKNSGKLTHRSPEVLRLRLQKFYHGEFLTLYYLLAFVME